MHENVFVEWVKLDMLSMARKVRWNLGGSLLGGWVRLVGIAGCQSCKVVWKWAWEWMLSSL
ncbi:hypothetical protein BDR07DRAFT_1389566, partial [Suillus spraguei]